MHRLPDPEAFEDNEIIPTGPSDRSDSGSDLAGLPLDEDNSDRNRTGDRPALEDDTEDAEGADIAADRIVEARQAGLGSGLDQAEEAQLGITDEEIADMENDAEGG